MKQVCSLMYLPPHLREGGAMVSPEPTPAPSAGQRPL